MTMKSVLFIFTLIGLTFALSKNEFQHPVKKPSPRSRGDNFVDPHTIPYMVSLHMFARDDDWYCGGTLISNNYVITAAACTVGCQNISVALGVHILHREEFGKITLTVLGEDVIRHEEYRNLTNDIALLKLPQPVEYSDTIKPVILPKKSDADTNYQGVIARVSGWGPNAWFGDISELPRYSFVEVLSNDACQGLSNPFPDTLLCTSGEYEGETAGPTTGDEGGPLILNGVLIGIISFGDIYWFGGEPGAHTRVASYLDWIEANSDVVIN